MEAARTDVFSRFGGSAPLLEREAELEALTGFVDRLGQDGGALVLVEGPAGIGKTRLLVELCALVGSRNLLVQRARGGELERAIPFGVVRQLLEPVVARSSEEARSRLLSGSARLAQSALGLPGAGDSARPGDPFAPIHGLYWLLANLADSQPVLLGIDDVHWADRQTLRFLDYVARRLGDLPVLVVACVRSGEPEELEELELLRLQGELVRPRALSQGALRELVAAELGAEPSAEIAEACARATAGNPFLIAEVLRGLRAEGIETPADAGAVISALGPESVARSALVRLGRFGDEAIALARAIAVLGGSPQLRHAAQLAGLAEERARALCDRLAKAEILTPGLPIDFVHPLVRQAIYQELPPGERAALHRRAAEILSSTGAAGRDVAPHLMDCVPNGDQWVVAQLAEAAREAVRAGAFESAQGYLERALREPPDDEMPLLYVRARSMLQTNPPRAARLLAEVADGASDQTLRAKALTRAAHGYFVAGEWGDAERCHSLLIEMLPSGDRESLLVAEAERYLAGLYLETPAVSEGDDSPSGRIESAAANLDGATPGECLARQALAISRFMRCAPAADVIELAASFPSGVWGIRTNVSPAACQILGFSGRWDDAVLAAGRLRELARESGSIIGEAYLSGLLADVHRGAGRLIEAEGEARTGLEIAGAAAAYLNPGREALFSLIATLVARGDLEEAARLAGDVDLSGGISDVPVSPWPLEVRAYLRLARGELEAAVEDLLQFGEEAERLVVLNPALCPWRQEAAPALAMLGRTAEAQDVIAVGERRARDFGAAHAIGTVLRSRALLEPRTRQIETLGESVTALDQYGPPHELARSLVELGAALRRDGQRSAARQPLRRALDLAHRCGAGGLQQRAREELAATGARPRRAMLTGRDALTATEQRVARMAAAGMSNPEIAQTLFVSRKTVENHLSHIYPKLGINSRAQLSAALAVDAPADAGE